MIFLRPLILSVGISVATYACRKSVIHFRLPSEILIVLIKRPFLWVLIILSVVTSAAYTLLNFPWYLGVNHRGIRPRDGFYWSVAPIHRVFDVLHAALRCRLLADAVLPPRDDSWTNEQTHVQSIPLPTRRHIS